MARSIQIHPGDNVATLLDDCAAEEAIELVGQAVSLAPHFARGNVARGHKVALAGIEPGSPVVKYGVPIGTAIAAIAAGEWVHLHNCRSGYDERPPAPGARYE